MIWLRLKKKFIIYILVFLLLGCQSQRQDTEKSVFSWHKQEVLNGKDDFFNTLQSFNVQNVYQYFSSDLTDDQIDSFINECSQQDISVYYLCGWLFCSSWPIIPIMLTNYSDIPDQPTLFSTFWLSGPTIPMNLINNEILIIV